jgi:hypothetical protein
MNIKSHHHLCAVKENGQVIERVIAQEQIDSLVRNSEQASAQFALFIDGLCRLPGHLSANQIQEREARFKLARVTTYQAREAA